MAKEPLCQKTAIFTQAPLLAAIVSESLQIQMKWFARGRPLFLAMRRDCQIKGSRARDSVCEIVFSFPCLATEPNLSLLRGAAKRRRRSPFQTNHSDNPTESVGCRGVLHIAWYAKVLKFCVINIQLKKLCWALLLFFVLISPGLIFRLSVCVSLLSRTHWRKAGTRKDLNTCRPCFCFCCLRFRFCCYRFCLQVALEWTNEKIKVPHRLRKQTEHAEEKLPEREPSSTRSRHVPTAVSPARHVWWSQ